MSKHDPVKDFLQKFVKQYEPISIEVSQAFHNLVAICGFDTAKEAWLQIPDAYAAMNKSENNCQDISQGISDPRPTSREE